MLGSTLSNHPLSDKRFDFQFVNPPYSYVHETGPVDEKRRKELQELFAGSDVHIVFVTAFETSRTMQTFTSEIAWESEVWIADDPDHMIHFNGERFLGPYPDVMPKCE